MASSSTYAFFHCHYAFQKFPFFCVTLCVLHALQNATLSHSINFFSWISSIFVGFFKSSRFFVSLCINHTRTMMTEPLIPPRNIGLPQGSSIIPYSWHRFWSPPRSYANRSHRKSCQFIPVSVSLIPWFRAHRGLAYGARVRCYINEP